MKKYIKSSRQGMEAHNSIGKVHGHMYIIELNMYSKEIEET